MFPHVPLGRGGFSDFPCFQWPRQSFCLFLLGFVWCFSLRVIGFWQEHPRYGTIFTTSHQGHTVSTWLLLLTVIWSFGWGHVCQVFALRSYFSPLFLYYILQKESLYTAPSYGMGCCDPPPWGQSIYINHMESFSMGICFFFPIYLFNYLFISMDSWVFILYFFL